MARPTRSRTRNLSLGPLVQHKPPSPRPGRNHTATSRKQTHNNTKESGLNKPPQNPGLDSLCHLGPTGGRTNPFMRSWTRHVEHGHPRPRSTHRVNVRIQGPKYPPIGPNMPSNSGTIPGTTTCPPAPHRHRGQPGAPLPEPRGPRRSRPHPAASCAQTARPGPAAQSSAPAPAS